METETINSVEVKKSRLFLKVLLIGGMMLGLLVPTFLVQNLIGEREDRQREAFTEVSSKWADRQNIIGPVLMLPYAEIVTDVKGQVSTEKRMAYILPDQLKLDASVKPEERHRGIFQVMLYSSRVNMSGKFAALPLQQLKIDPASVYWNEAAVIVSIADPKGLRDELKIKWNDSILTLAPAVLDNEVVKEGFTAPVTITANTEINFSADINLLGSEQLLFTPVGKETIVKLSSSWPDPSFTGGQLPDHRIADSGFTATWKNLSHTRKFPQAWKDNAAYSLTNASFGADLFIPVNGYQKTMRSVKYAILCILLTFAAFFIIETVNKKSVHPFQYGLIGLALVLFYTLLLSFSEYTGFNTAYIIASVATIGLIAWFVKDILQSSRLSVVLSVLLMLLYSYVFTILQLQDYSLLLGSIGLFLTLAVIMHFSKKIQW
jgi:inner membrane protein